VSKVGLIFGQLQDYGRIDYMSRNLPVMFNHGCSHQKTRDNSDKQKSDSDKGLAHGSPHEIEE